MSNIDFQQLEFVDIKLRKIHKWIEEKTGLTFTITSIYRINDPGVHGKLPVRGTDIRIRNKEIGEIITDYINKNWQYDINRPNLKCAVIHGEGYNLHIHLQVHTNTKKL